MRDPFGQHPRLPCGHHEQILPFEPHALRAGRRAHRLREPPGGIAPNANLRRHGVHHVSDLASRATGDETAAQDDGQPRVQCLHLVEQVAGHDQRAWPASHGIHRHSPVPHEADKVVPGHRIESIEGLVEHEEIGVVRHGARQLRPLSQPLGKRGERSVHRLTQAHTVEFPIGPLGRGSPSEAGEPHEIPNPLPWCSPPFQEVGGGTEPDPPQHPRIGKRPFAKHADLSHRRPQLAGDEPQQRCLAGTIGAEETVGTAPQLHRHVVDADHRPEDLRDVCEGEHGSFRGGESEDGR